ncbi:MAG: ATP-binding protein [Candidatus Omnitrophota bacterium]
MIDINNNERNNQLMQLEKLASLGTLAAGIAHEINNPLTFIITNLNLLTMYTKGIAEGQKEQEIKESIDECLEGANRIKRIVQDLLSFAHTSGGKRVSADINSLVESALRILWNQVKYKADVVKDYKAETYLLVDPAQISQVFVNILMNSAQSLNERGSITVATFEDDSAINIKVSDTGCGIASENLPKIFEPFFTTKGAPGLGLHVAKSLLDSYGGKVIAESEVGSGSTFTVVIPKHGNI